MSFAMPRATEAGSATAELEALRSAVEAIGEVLAENGCDCACNCHPEEHDSDCERCLACRIGAKMPKMPRRRA